MAPFAAAVGVFALVVIGVAVFTMTRGDDDGLSEDQRVGRAAVGQNDALQRKSYADYQRYTCTQQQGREAEVLSAQEDSTRQNGARYVDDVTGVKIDGNSATGTVAYHFQNDSNNKRSTPMTFARQDGQWKVCGAYK